MVGMDVPDDFAVVVHDGQTTEEVATDSHHHLRIHGDDVCEKIEPGLWWMGCEPALRV